jgi:CarD family transcriptional regulator
MFKKNEYVVYGNDVCQVADVKVSSFDNSKYYVLKPMTDTSLTISIPVDSPKVRKIMSKKEAMNLIDTIAGVKTIDVKSEKMYGSEYKELFSTGDHTNLIKIIKTTYMRNKKRKDNNKKISDIDDTFFKKSERLLYDELAIALGKSYDETKEYINEVVGKDASNNE